MSDLSSMRLGGGVSLNSFYICLVFGLVFSSGVSSLIRLIMVLKYGVDTSALGPLIGSLRGIAHQYFRCWQSLFRALCAVRTRRAWHFAAVLVNPNPPSVGGLYNWSSLMRSI